MNQKIKKQIQTLGLALVLGTSAASAQTLAQARTWYNQGDYAQAKPVMERYYKSQPSNGSYSLWLSLIHI